MQHKKTISPNNHKKKFLRLASFTEFNPRPVVETDFTGNILYMNPAARAAFPDLEKKGAKHNYLSNLETIVNALKNGENQFSREIKIKEKWFRHFFYETSFQSIIIYGLDITQQKQIDEEIKKNEKRYHLLFEKMNYGNALQDIIFNKNKKPANYRFIDINPAFEKLTKLKKDHIIGKTIEEISTAPKTKESVELRKKYDKVATSGEPFYFENYNEKLKKHFEMYAYKPNERQIALILSDITHRKKLDEEKNNFISIMSHELRNPLTPIMANAQFINSVIKNKKINNPIIKESIDIIEKNAKMMANLLNDILDVARFQHQKIQLKKEKINICDIIKQSAKSSMPFINTKNQKLSIFFEKNPLYIYADSVRIEQIMVNLINNASKYTKPKGHIDVYCGVKENSVEINVKDNGIGMDAEKIKYIFELFNDKSQPFLGIGGLGIGLNIVKNLVSMHRGNLSVKSSGKNKGSQFTINLPLYTKTTLKPIKIKQSKTVKNHYNSKVLIVDDNEDILDAIAKILQQEGYIIQTANKGLDAIKISKSFQPDTALIDIGLPDINGYKVAKAIAKDNAKKIKLIALTGYGQQSDKNFAKEAGFDYHLTKPVDIDQLIKKINIKKCEIKNPWSHIIK